MKKIIILLSLLLNFSSIKAQVIHDSLSEEVIKNAPYIIEGLNLSTFYCNCLSKEYYDRIIRIKLTDVIRGGGSLRTGDSIFLLIPRVGYKEKFKGSIIDPEEGDAARIRFADCFGSGCGGQFLVLNKIPIIDKEWVDKKLFVLYPSKTFSSYWPSDFYVENPEFEITALNWLKFKTKQDWYNYLKQFPDIKIPGEK
jgi:hypothetical protein